MNIAIIGGGPAGLRAAEIAAAGGAAVAVYDAKASVGRKFLVAGRGGLNLTKDEPRAEFATRYHGGGDEMWAGLLADCDAEALRAWAAELGIETFAAKNGRVYPRGMKAAPLLRRWVQRLRERGVHFAMHHRWLGIERGKEWTLDFQTKDERRTIPADAVILALGGASWPDTGSDGAWTSILTRLGVYITPLAPANCGWKVPWPPALLDAVEGQPLKNIVARAGDVEAAGELLITQYGLEGGAIYELCPALRAMPVPRIAIDLKPGQTAEQLVAKMAGVREHFLAKARDRWRLSDAALALLAHRPRRRPFASAESLAAETKNCILRLTGPRPIGEAISSAGGVRWDELDDALMLRRLPGVFVAGEMIDWEAPTGGYLIQGCFATGTRAARGALGYGASVAAG